MVQIGSEHVPWTEFCQFTSKYLEGPRSVLAAAKGFEVLNTMIERFSAGRKTPQMEHTLLALAWVFPQLICFDPRDKIYGLLGLLTSNIRVMIRPDYERADTKRVFSSATYAEIVCTKSMGILALARRQSITVGLPSWTVDFVYPKDMEHAHIPALIESWLDFFRSSPRSWTRVAPHTNADVDYNAENASLTIVGLSFDEVSFAIPMIDAKAKDALQGTSWKRMALASTSLTSRLVLRKEEREFRHQILAPLDSQTAYQRLLDDEEAYSSPPVYKQDSIRPILVETIMTDWLYHDAHADHRCVEDEFEEDDALPAALGSYFDHLAGNSEMSGTSTSFFVTSKGFIGAGPRHMRCDDRIILPYGSNYPMLLRPNSENRTWTFLGFVHVT